MTHFELVINQNYGGLNPVQFGYQKCTPSHFWGPAVRTHWLLHYVVSGCGIFKYKDVAYPVHSGEIFVIPPYEETYYEADSEKPWHYIWIGFTTNEQLPDAFFHPVIRGPGIGTPFEEMKHCKNIDNGRSAYLSSCLWKLMSILLEQGNTPTDYIDKALHYIHSEYASNITVSGIADYLNLERCYFSTLFAKRTGVSPQEYLMKYRLTKAAELMISYGESPSTAAVSVGYSNIYHFSKIFKKYFGLSPRAYIREQALRKK